MTATPLRVTAQLDSLTVEQGGPFGLDAPLSWGMIERAKTRGEQLPPITPQFAPDLPLPLERHPSNPWVWCTSRAHWEVQARVAVNVRRKTATAAMSRYARDAKHHSGLGPFKARDALLPAMAARTVWWDILCTDRGELESILAYVTHLGPRRRNGFGHVASWMVDDGPTGGWRDRMMPNPDGVTTEAVRAPYWHATRRAVVA